MDNDGSTSRQQRSPSSLVSSNNTSETCATVSNNANSSAFVNHALVLWKERRQEWVGARQRPRVVEPREPVIRVCTVLPKQDLSKLHRLETLSCHVIGSCSFGVIAMWGAWDVSWSTTYEDLLATTRPFSQRIPLTEMVDFLVDVWEQEGLYE